jgi:hypothetical protein
VTFDQHCQLWQAFHQRRQQLEHWIEQAQNIVNGKHGDHIDSIRKHNEFFQSIDDTILHGFMKSGRELLHIRDVNEQRDIQLLMTTLESKWNTIVCCAPLRLLRLSMN